MTSVYGVTYIGAKKQIQEKIEEKVSFLFLWTIVPMAVINDSQNLYSFSAGGKWGRY